MNAVPKRLIAVPALAAALAFTACAPAPSAPSESESPSAAQDCARMVTNSGGLEDRSFNQSSWEGLELASSEYGIDVQALVSTGPSDLEPNLELAVGSGCGFILTVGWELAEGTLAQAEANPDLHFAIVDEKVEAPNVVPIVFDTAQASYLAGYLAAGMSKTGVVATFGGEPQPPVALFMDGFVDGVAKYNEVHGADVRVLGWDKAAQDGTFIGSWEDTNLGKVATENFIAQGADVILPVAAQAGEGTLAAALDHGGVLVIWVDADGVETLPAEYHPVLLTSVLKKTQDAVVELVGRHLDGSFTGGTYVGTLENGGTDIAPYHELDDAVSDDLKAEIDELRAQIISGEIVVESVNAP